MMKRFREISNAQNITYLSIYPYEDSTLSMHCTEVEPLPNVSYCTLLSRGLLV